MSLIVISRDATVLTRLMLSTASPIGGRERGPASNTC